MRLHPLFRGALLTAATVSACLLITAPASATPSLRTPAGTTRLTLDNGFITAGESLGLKLTVISSAKTAGGGTKLIFPIVGGAVDAANALGQIVHTGGIEVAGGGATVDVTDFIIDTTSSTAGPQLSVLATVNGSVSGRLAIFNLQFPTLSFPLKTTKSKLGFKELVIDNVKVTLSAQGATTLNALFKTTALTPGLTIGVAKVTVLLPKTLP